MPCANAGVADDAFGLSLAPHDFLETYARTPVRMWTYLHNMAWPTEQFYQDRIVFFSNLGSDSSPCWVALDQFNGTDRKPGGYKLTDLRRLYDRVIGRKEGFDLLLKPRINLAPPAPGASLMTRIIYRLSKFVD